MLLKLPLLKNNLNNRASYYFLLFCLLFFTSSSFAAEKIGKISFSRGTIAANQPNEQPRLIGKGAEIKLGDNIQTSDGSFVIIEFDDGTKITVRPNSNFTVDQFSISQQSAKMSLHQGGIRASSGEIANSAPENMEITTPHTTIKAQQADFSIRVCEGEICQQEEDHLSASVTAKTSQVVARVVDVKGTVIAQNADNSSNEQRLLHIGAPIYNDDNVTSDLDGFAVLVFSDQGRVTVDSDTQFKVSEYRYHQKDASDNAAYELITGAMRVLTGKIGKEDKQAFQVNTPVATIGIRGTGFDLVSQQTGLYSKVWQGQIFQRNEAGTFDLIAPKTNYISTKNAIPVAILALPDTSKLNGPRPDKITIENETELFKTVIIDRTAPGTYTDVHSGHLQVKTSSGEYVDLGASEASFTDIKGVTIRIEIPPKFMQQDIYPLPTDSFNENIAEVTTFSMLTDNMTLDVNGETLQCECK